MYSLFFFLVAVALNQLPVPRPIQAQTLGYFDADAFYAMELPNLVLSDYAVLYPAGLERGVGYAGWHLWLWKAERRPNSWRIQRFEHLFGTMPDSPVRWQIRYGHHWASELRESFTGFYHIPLEDDLALFKYRRKPRELEEEFVFHRLCLQMRWGTNPIGYVLGPYLMENEWSEPLKDDVPYFTNPRRGTPLPRYAHCDMLPLDNDEIWMFLLLKERLYLWPGKLRLEEGEKRIDGQKNPKNTIPANLREGFSVYGDRQAVYFVTYSGQVYVWSRPGKRDQSFGPYWTDKDRPIEVVLGDASSTRTWVFTKAGKNKEHSKAVYFELHGDKAETVAYEPRRFDGPREMPRALQIVMPYYQIIQEKLKN